MESPAISDLSRETKAKEFIDAFLSTGSEIAFSVLASMLFPKLVRYFSMRGLGTETAEELAQDVLMVIYQKSEALLNKQRFFGWLYRIARNRHLQYLRRRKNGVQLVDLDCAADLAAYETHWTIQEAEFYHLIAPLEVEEQKIVILRYREDLSYVEIAAVLALPMGTVKWKLSHVKSKLTTLLGKSQGRTA